MVYWYADSITKLVTEKNGFVFKQTRKKGKWVNLGLAKEAKEWNTFPGFSYHLPTWITAPTGSGKSTFILEDLATAAKEKGKAILFFSSRTAQIIQQKRDKAIDSGIALPSMDLLGDIQRIDNIYISTYNGWFSFQGKNLNTLPPIEYVVFDEIHSFLYDSAFNPNTFEILYRIISSFIHTPRIYLTATPEYIQEAIACIELQLAREITKTEYTETKLPEYIFSPSYYGISVRFFYDYNTIKKRINQSNDKWLVFVSDKESGKTLAKELTSDVSDYMDSESKNVKPDLFTTLIQSKKFSKKVLVCTSVLDSGFTINDDALKNIVVDFYDRSQVIQMLGRKRRLPNEEVTLYIHIPMTKTIRHHLKSAKNIIQLLSDKGAIPSYYLHSQWGDIPSAHQKVFRASLNHSQNGTYDPYSISFYPNPMAHYYYYIFSGICERVLGMLESDDPCAFQKYVLNWFDIPFSEEYTIDSDKELFSVAKTSFIKLLDSWQDKFPLNDTDLFKMLQEADDLILDSGWNPDGKRYRRGQALETRKTANLNYLLETFGTEYKIVKGTDVTNAFSLIKN